MTHPSTKASKIVFQEGEAHLVDDVNQLPLVVLRELGNGHSGVVKEVQDENTGLVFAQKTIRIPKTRFKGGQAVKEKQNIFRNESEIIHRLNKHHHIIRVFATYTTTFHFALLLQPVADEGDLQEFMIRCGERADNYGTSQFPDVELQRMHQVLERAFGCLAKGLAFMHESKIRHKDIKPHNILVHNGSVIYTDFGYSLDFMTADDSITEGKPAFITARYAAPEVLEHEQRRASSDVFSLGCVFIEMLELLSGAFKLDDVEKFSSYIEHVHMKISQAKIPSRLSFLAEIVVGMTLQSATSRPSSHEVSTRVFVHSGFGCSQCSTKQPQRSTDVQTKSYDPNRITSQATTAFQQGQLIAGTYNGHNNTQRFETLDPSYCVRQRSFFQEGRVFSMLFTEAAGSTVTDYNSSYSNMSLPIHGELVHTQIRRFIVVRQRREFCFAVPIFTYGGRATTKRGVLPNEHAIAYSYGHSPRYVEGEVHLEKKPICIIMNEGERVLHFASRINFAIHHPIQYNVKVKNLGHVHPDQMQDFLECWFQEFGIRIRPETS